MRCWVAVLLFPFYAVAAERPGDFAYGMPIQTEGNDALVQVELPQPVYETVVRADLGDVRVFNGAGEPVPHAFRPRVTARKERAAPMKLTLFPIHAEAGTRVDGVDLRIDRIGDRTVLNLRTPDGKRPPGATLVGYVADASAIEKPLGAIVLDLPPSPASVVAKVSIEASDDLRQWRALAYEAPVVRLESGGQRLEQLRIEFAPRRAKYLRISWAPQARPLDLRGLAAEPADGIVEPERQWKQASSAAKGKPGDYEFDLEGQFPVDRLRIALPQQNTVASVELSSRAKPADPWRRVATSTVYRLNREGEEVKSPDIAVPPSADRYWLLHIDQRGGGIGSEAPALHVGWVPHRLVFAARGAAPFLLAYGSRDAKPAAYPIATLVPGYSGEETLELKRAQIGTIQTTEQRPLGGEAALHERVDWKRWTLWGSLVLGVAALGWMALRLGRQMTKPDNATTAARADPTRNG